MKRYIRASNNKEFGVHYQYYDHLEIRNTPDEKELERIFKNHDFEGFKKMVKKYPSYIDSQGYEVVYFPETAFVYDNSTDDFVGEINIMNKENFNKIDSAEFECG